MIPDFEAVELHLTTSSRRESPQGTTRVSGDANKTRSPHRGNFVNTAYGSSSPKSTTQQLRRESVIDASTRASLVRRDTVIGPLRRPWVYTNFSISTFISHSKVSLTTVTAEQETADLSTAMVYDENLASSLTEGDTLSQILDLYGD